MNPKGFAINLFAVPVIFSFENIDREYRHRPADEHHVGVEGPYLGWQELVLKTHLVHHVSDNTRKQLLLHDPEKLFIALPKYFPHPVFVLFQKSRLLFLDAPLLTKPLENPRASLKKRLTLPRVFSRHLLVKLDAETGLFRETNKSVLNNRLFQPIDQIVPEGYMGSVEFQN